MSEPDFLSATRAAYDTVAQTYAKRFRDELPGKPLDRAMLDAFAELVRAGAKGPVADVGCGPGHITHYLGTRGLDAFGVDLSPEMVAAARQAFPSLRFDVGSMAALDLPDGGLAGLVAFYSVIHIPTAELPAVFTEFRRVLRPGAQLLLAFQTGNEQVHLTEGFGHTVSLDFYLRPPQQVEDMLTQAGLPVHARLVRDPDDTERTARAYLLARRLP